MKSNLALLASLISISSASADILPDALKRAIEISATHKVPVWITQQNTENGQVHEAVVSAGTSSGLFGLEAIAGIEVSPSGVIAQPNFLMKVPGSRGQVILHTGYALGAAAGDRFRIGAKILLAPHMVASEPRARLNFYLASELSPGPGQPEALDSIYSASAGLNVEYTSRWAYPLEMGWVSYRGPNGATAIGFRAKTGVTRFFGTSR